MATPSLPRVTDILASCGLSADLSGIAPAVLERARHRGTILHEAIEAHTYGYFSPDMLDEETKPYFGAYERFLSDTGYKPIVAEVEVVSARWGFIGHADGVGWIGSERVLPDWKTVATLDIDAVRYQLAGYVIGWEEQHPREPIKRRLAVQFKPDGTYRMEEDKTPAESTQVFQAAVLVYHARMRRVA